MVRLLGAVVWTLLAAGLAWAQQLPGPAPESVAPQPLNPGVAAATAAPLAVQATPAPTAAPSTASSGELPNQHGQLWREYDISPYTARITNTKRPEQALVDWVLRETGYETWHSEPLAILSATPRTLRVYHTPQIHAVVHDAVDRFLNAQAGGQAFNIRVLSVETASWRARVQRLLVPVQVQTPGVQAWLLQPEAAAMVLADLRRRADFREYNAPQQTVVNGQPLTINAMQARSYVRNLAFRPDLLLGYEPEMASIDAGYQLEFVPLLSTDGRTIDAMVKFHIDQVEKLDAVMIDVPTVASPRQRVKIEVPQMAQFRFHERFRWPVDQVLLIGLGVVPNPASGGGSALSAIPLVGGGDGRVDMLLMVDSKPAATSTVARPQPAVPGPYPR